MGWKDAFDYLRGAAAKRGLAGEERVDTGLPLGARIGSLLKMQLSPFIRANANGSLIEAPALADNRIVAISQIKLNLAGGLYRFYLANGDDDAKEQFLQVFRAEHDEAPEVMYCSQLARIIPETAEDQDAYTGAGDCGLGDATYTLWREQMTDIGLDDAQLKLVFGEADRIDYQRDAGQPDQAFVAPFKGSETRIDDQRGVRGLKQEMYFMPYVRALANGGREYLLITTEILTSVNGDTSKRGIHVDFVIGIPLESERVVVQ